MLIIFAYKFFKYAFTVLAAIREKGCVGGLILDGDKGHKKPMQVDFQLLLRMCLLFVAKYSHCTNRFPCSSFFLAL